MTSEMTPERLAELRGVRDEIRGQDYASYGQSYEEHLADSVDEIDRRGAEIERLRTGAGELHRRLVEFSESVTGNGRWMWRLCCQSTFVPLEKESHDEGCPFVGPEGILNLTKSLLTGVTS